MFRACRTRGTDFVDELSEPRPNSGLQQRESAPSSPFAPQAPLARESDDPKKGLDNPRGLDRVLPQADFESDEKRAAAAV
jgi:hypothetical protein